MQNTCRLWGQSFHLPTEVERKLKENWRLFVSGSIASPDPQKPQYRSILSRSRSPDRHLIPSLRRGHFLFCNRQPPI
ncbi:hypothetical protein [Microcoleus sp. herbarium12]|uniref:hypothetical protein n=1 Tax=Microcoleus sp. herbarium12 TaxID=3055437 RepID=UPI002FD72846